jgi:F-type H+-transporting ATPase subunit b
MLDKRAEGIQSELDEARALREEAQTLLASYERMQKDVQDKAARIVEQARADAAAVAEQAKEDLKVSIARRMQAAEDRIASAEAGAVREVRNQAISIAIAAAQEVIAKQMTATDANKLIDDAINTVDAKLH